MIDKIVNWQCQRDMWLLYVKCHHIALQSTSLWMWLHGWSVMRVNLWKLSS